MQVDFREFEELFKVIYGNHVASLEGSERLFQIVSMGLLPGVCFRGLGFVALMFFFVYETLVASDMFGTENAKVLGESECGW